MARTTQRKRRRRTRESSATLVSSSESDGGGSGSEDEREESEKQERRWQLRQSTLDRKGKGKEVVEEDGREDDEESSSGGESADEGNNGDEEAEAEQQQQQQLQARGDYGNNNKSATPREEICGICLSEGGNERGKLDCCDHFFCFACIMEWSKVESRCPLCKQRFITVMRPPLPGVTRSRTRSVRIPIRDQVYEPSEEEIRLFTDPYQNTVCTECQEAGDEGLLLLCDRCDGAAHTYCVGLGRSVPRGDWFCQACQSLENESSDSEDEEDTTFDTTDIDEEEGSGTDSLLAMLVGDVRPNFFGGRTLRSTANRRGAIPLRRSTRRRARRSSLSESNSIAGAFISMTSTPTSGYFPTLTETHPARTLSHQRQVQATVQNRLQNMRENWNRLRSGELQFGSVGHSVESSRPGSAAGGSSSTPRLGYGGRSTTAIIMDSEAPTTTSQTTRAAGRSAEAGGELERAWANMGRAIRLVGSNANTSASRVNSSTDRKGTGEVKPMGTPVSARTRERSHQADLMAKANSSRGPPVERTDNYSRANSSRGVQDDRHPHHVDSHDSGIDSSARGGIDLFNARSSNSRDFNCREQSSRQQSFAGRASENGHVEILGGGDNSRSGYNLRESSRQHLSRTGNNPKDNAVTAGSARSPTSILDEKDSSRGSGGVSMRRFVREAKELQCSQGHGILDDKDNSRGPVTRWRESLHGRGILDDKDNSNSNSRGSIGPTTRREADRIRSQSLSQDTGQPGSRNSCRDGELKAMKEQCFSLVQVALKPSLDKGAIDKIQFKELARSATHTILSSLGVPGLKHGTDVVAVGTITCDHEQPTSSSLIPGCCTSCVQRHVKKYVKSLVKAKNTFA